MKRLLLAATLSVGLAASFVPFANAQGNGVALAAAGRGNPLPPDGFVGPWATTATGIKIAYDVLCYHTFTRDKRTLEVIVDVPDGSTLNDVASISTTGIVNACAFYGITVPRAGVILPSIRQGL